jgi:hypothetical protein
MPEAQPVIVQIEWARESGNEEVAWRDDLEKVRESSEQALNAITGTIRVMADRVARSIRDLEREVMPDEVEIQFSIKLELEGGTVVPLVAKTTSEGQISVKFKWNVIKPEQAQVLLSGK